MHPLVPFILGEKHPLGNRIVDVQKCLRTQDIDEVGDTTHTTFFEMLGNWSFGDYFKKEAIEWSFEFLTSKKWLNLPMKRLAITCFKGDDDAPKDEEAAGIWLSLGIPKERIAFLPKEDNWWSSPGETGPCGPDTEMFYWVGEEDAPAKFNPKDKKWVEIWNDVFMQYNKTGKGYEELEQKTVDTGLGVERVAMALQGKQTIFDTELFQPIFEKLNELTEEDLDEKNVISFRIMADHLRAATFILGDERGVVPSNVDQGYILRRFIRRTLRHGKKLGMEKDFCPKVAEVIIKIYKKEYPLLGEKKKFIIDEFRKEEEKFDRTLEKGLKMFEKMSSNNEIDAKEAFLLFQSYGFPIEITEELAEEKGIKVDVKGFEEEFKKHQELSRVGAEKKFKGGLGEMSGETLKLHTATHLLNEALRRVVSKDIKQKGSNITPERLRFDFNFDRKLTPEEKKAVEDEVNRIIGEGLEVMKEEMPLKKALKSGAQAEFGTRYPEMVTVYSIGDYSKEICMGPHVKNTKDLGKFRIKKEESSAAGVRRIKAVLE
jgi:alanyl-tRNA synthetase